jgi:hypothetical protein
MTKVSDIKSRPISTQEDLERLKTFAESFGHKLTPGFLYDVFYVDDENWLGYAEHAMVPVWRTGWHPKNASGETLAAIQALQAFSHMRYGLTFAQVSDDSPLAPVMPKLGFVEQGKLWMSVGR